MRRRVPGQHEYGPGEHVPRAASGGGGAGLRPAGAAAGEGRA